MRFNIAQKVVIKNLIILFVIATFFTSCSVTESIVFNNDMSGEYRSSFDLTPLMNYASENSPGANEAFMNEEKVDTTVVFNDLFENYKDSIATLSEAQRSKLENLKGMSMRVHMDVENDVFEIAINKSFKTVSELENINERVDEAMGIAKAIGSNESNVPDNQLDELTKVDKVVYTFKDGAFRRYMPNAVAEQNKTDEHESTVTDKSDFATQFEEMFSSSYYTLVYSFPKRVKSVSNENAIISEDGKKVTYKIGWSDLKQDVTSMNLNIVLED
ncbi:hypothetical protein [Winogradskyella sediminis]|uniref:hypothetical protein n=1 Tax=Winogradskyella sediminis TaxID=1382466 RepID=UPI000E37C15F|nr:hypothetical protein [Winogradskyella sediminis]REG88781.1 hypothetical protein C8N41_10111 [Winogradskyella sediminis]